jgi:hypothetical protein
VAKKERRDGPPEREREHDQDGDIAEGERDSLVALKSILGKVAGLLKPLGLSPEESTRLVERMYESVLEMDMHLAGESDEERRRMLLSHVQSADVRRVDDQIVVDYRHS